MPPRCNMRMTAKRGVHSKRPASHTGRLPRVSKALLELSCSEEEGALAGSLFLVGCVGPSNLPEIPEIAEGRDVTGCLGGAPKWRSVSRIFPRANGCQQIRDLVVQQHVRLSMSWANPELRASSQEPRSSTFGQGLLRAARWSRPTPAASPRSHAMRRGSSKVSTLAMSACCFVSRA